MRNGLYKYLPENSAGTSENSGGGLYKYMSKTADFKASEPTHTSYKPAALPTGANAKSTPKRSFGTRLISFLKSGLGNADVDFGTYTPAAAKNNTRVENTLASGITSWGSGMGKTLAAFIDPSGADEAGDELDAAFGSGTGNKIGALPGAVKLNSKASNTLQTYAEQQNKKAAEYDAEARKGLGTFGNLLVSAGESGAQMALDFAATGGKGTLASMGARSFGSHLQEAEQESASKDDAVNYAVGAAAIDVLTEKISSVAKPFQKMFGKGLTDGVSESLINLARTQTGRTALRTLMSAGGEGFEEVVADWLNPFVRQQTINKGKSYGELYDSKQTLQDGLVGAIMGLAGGATELPGAVGQDISNNRLIAAQSAQAANGFNHLLGRVDSLNDTGKQTTADNFASAMAQQQERQADYRLLRGQSYELPAVDNTKDINDRSFQSKLPYKMGDESLGVVAKVKAAIPALSDMEPLSVISGNELKSGKTRITERAYDYISNLGFKVNRPDLGDVEFSKTGIKRAFVGHGFGQAKEAAFAAVPDIIRYGRQIDHSDNWKGRGISMNLYAGPAKISKAKTYVGVVVAYDNTSNRYYLHEVVDDTGNIIYEETPQKSSDGRPDHSGIDTVTSDEVSDNSISESAPKSNTENTAPITLEEYLGARGFAAPVDDYMVDKMRLPHGETSRQLAGRTAEAARSSEDYHSRRNAAIKEYQDKVSRGEIRDKTYLERKIETALGNEDNEATQAARRLLAKRGIDWHDYIPKTKAEENTNISADVESKSKIKAESKKNKTDIESSDSIRKRRRGEFSAAVSEIFGDTKVKSRAMRDAVDTVVYEMQHNPSPDINRIYDSFNTLWESAKVTQQAEDVYKAAAESIRGRSVFVNDSIRSEIGDDWKSFSARARKLGLKLTTDINDRGVDVLYSELAESFPGMYDSANTDGSQMLYDLVDTLQASKDTVKDLPAALEDQYGKAGSEQAKNDIYKKFMGAASSLYNDTKADMADRHEAITANREFNSPQKQLERAKQEITAERPKTTTAIDKVTGSYPITTDIAYNGAEGLVAREKAAYKTKKLVEKMVKDLNPTAQERAFAKDIASGLYTENDIPITLNSRKVKALADYFTAEGSYKENLLAQRGRDNKAAREEIAERLVANSTGYKPPKALSLNFNTMKRNIERSFGSEAPEIIRWTIDPIRENSKNKKLWQMDKRAGLDAFRLTKEESALVQQVIEGRAAGEEMAKLDPHEQKDIKSVIQNMSNGQSRAKANAEFNLNQTQLDLAERFMKWQNTQAALKNVDADKVTKAADWLTKQYGDIYDAINDFLTAHGYKPIGFIKGYAPHLQPEAQMSGFAAALQRLGLETEVVELPTEIAGRTETFKPGKSWVPNFLSRGKGEYEDDAVAGWESYTDYISNVLYHTDDIQKLRVLSETLRSKYASDEIREQISWARGMRDASPVDKTQELKRLGRISPATQLTAEQADFEWQKYTDSLFEDINNLTKYGDFVSVLDDYTNKLAMKQTKLDRSIESLVGRKALNLGNQLTKIFGESTIVGNLSSALNQTAQLPMLRAEVGGKYIREALKDIADGTMTAEEFDKQSAFLVGKKDLKSASDSRTWKDKTAQQKKAAVMDIGAIPFEAVDDLASKLIVRSKYLEALGNGKSAEEAVKIADEYADRLVGSREQGMKPMIFENKNAVTKLFTTFQLEVANTWEHLSHDLPAEYKAVESAQGKNAAVKLIAGRIVKYLISAFLLNRLTDEIYGGTPAPFDVGGYILGSVAAGYGKSTNSYLASIIDNGMEQLGGERIFGTKKSDKFDFSAAADELGYSAGGDIPYLSNAGAMLGITDTTLPIPQVWNSKLSGGAKALLKSDDADSRKSALQTIGEGAGKAASTWLPMGNQIRKTASGALMLAKGGKYSGNSLEYPTESGAKGLLTGAKALAFGPNSTQAAQNYYASGAKKLTAKQTAAYESAVKLGEDKQNTYDTIQSVRSSKKTDALTETQAKIKALQDSNISSEAKRAVYAGTISDKHDDDIRNIITAPGEKKLSFDDYLAIQYEYTAINQKNIKATEKATEFSSWINRQKYSGAQEKAVKEAFKYYNSSVAESTAYDKMSDAGLSDSTSKSAADALLKLPSTATEYDRYRAAASAMPTDAAKLKALSALMTDSDGNDNGYQKLKTGYDYGVSPEVYLTVKEQISGLDHLNQSSVESLLNGILGLDSDQKAALWQLANKSWKGYKNPYNTKIGNAIYQAYN